MIKQRYYPYIQAFTAALLFGASPPLSKLLQGNNDPISMAAFLYLGAGIGLFIFKLLQRLLKYDNVINSRFSRNDTLWLTGAIFSGGIAAPVILLYSLQITPAATASLLLNFEGVATMFIAVLIFGEALGKKMLISVVAITCGSIILSWNTNGEWGFSIGAIGVIGACILWGIDNNLTRNISSKDPLTIVMVKGLIAGTFSLVFAVLTRSSISDMKSIAMIMGLGCISYGISTILFIFSLRSLGAARTSVFSGIAPFVGAIISFILFKETPSTLFYAALPMMIFGVSMIISEAYRG